MQNISVSVQTEDFSCENMGYLTNCVDTDKYILEYCDLSALYSLLFTNKTLSNYSNNLILLSMDNILSKVLIYNDFGIRSFIIPKLTFINIDIYFNNGSSDDSYIFESKTYEDSLENVSKISDNFEYSIHIKRHQYIISLYINWLIISLRKLYKTIYHNQSYICFQEFIYRIGLDMIFITGYEDKKVPKKRTSKISNSIKNILRTFFRIKYSTDIF
jgi:hypothetical protein